MYNNLLQKTCQLHWKILFCAKTNVQGQNWNKTLNKGTNESFSQQRKKKRKKKKRKGNVNLIQSRSQALISKRHILTIGSSQPSPYKGKLFVSSLPAAYSPIGFSFSVLSVLASRFMCRNFSLFFIAELKYKKLVQ